MTTGKDLKTELAIRAFGMNKAQAHAQLVCISCKQPPTFYSEAGRKEYAISGMCEPCFDKLFSEEESND